MRIRGKQAGLAPACFFLSVTRERLSNFIQTNIRSAWDFLFLISGADNCSRAFSNHSSPHKILLTKLLALLILPLKDPFISFCRRPREKVIDPEGSPKKTNGTLRSKEVMGPPFEVP
jgi:hypothetical protein